MKISREWMDEQEIFDAVVGALDGNVPDGFRVIARDEPSSYGDRGYIQIRFGGRIFNLDLSEIE